MAPTILVAAAAILDDAGRVLLARRPPGKALASLWEFPGGKVAPGETPEAALVRELAEELGIEVAEGNLSPLTFASHAYADADSPFHLLMPLYTVTVWRGDVGAVGREGQALEWVRAGDLRRKAMPPADAPLLPAVEAAVAARAVPSVADAT